MKIAFVIPWYGDIPGGAENECKRTAENLNKSGIEVEILTTCVKEFLSDWNNNFHKEGVYDVNGIKVRRFRVRKRDTRSFDRINYKLMHNQKVSPEEEVIYINEMINSDNLYKYILENKSEYDYFFFIPYMFGTTYFGSKICPEKSILIPCLHDETYAYMGIFKEMFERVKGIIFLSHPEMELAEKLYDLKSVNRMVMGGGIDTDIEFNAKRFKDKYLIEDDYVLYAGRRDIGKNVPLLIDYFCKYKDKNDNRLKLVLIGSGDINIPGKHKDNIIDLKFIPKQDKYDAYAASLVLCQPSVNESFSLVIMESWLCGTPVLVHADCEVTKDHCIKSNGGLYFRDFNEFEECLNFFIQNPNTAKKMGTNGKQYVLDNYNWDTIVRGYKKIFNEWRDHSANTSDAHFN
ncbi:MAG TPA: glycosyltransferase family 4 protein [Candidatus Limnocylindrales bacterium]|nr:glycosyltransferase family 4 protein [Candidatus Limnocylindrales bacterium]